MFRVSVIIPNYNRKEHLKRALDSVMGQSLAPLEVIVVDDGSPEIDKKFYHDLSCFYKELRPEIPLRVYRRPHRGVSAARNYGIAVAKGLWLAFLDSDDAWLVNKLAMQQEEVKKDKNCRIVHGNELWLRNGKKVKQKAKHRKAALQNLERYLALCLISPSAAVVRKNVFEEFGLFDESYRVCEDYDFWLRVAPFVKVGFCAEPIITKYGDSGDHLSLKHSSMDFFRWLSGQKLLKRSLTLNLSLAQQELIQDAMNQRLKILKRSLF